MAKAKLEKPAWLKMNEKELKKIIEDLAKKYAPSKIGTILRDQYGVPTVRLYGKKLYDYLAELGIQTNEELEAVERKVEKIKSHLKKNITDKKAKHKLQKAQTRFNKLKKHYSKKS